MEPIEYVFLFIDPADDPDPISGPSEMFEGIIAPSLSEATKVLKSVYGDQVIIKAYLSFPNTLELTLNERVNTLYKQYNKMFKEGDDVITSEGELLKFMGYDDEEKTTGSFEQNTANGFIYITRPMCDIFLKIRRK